jgi:hypothetical protein
MIEKLKDEISEITKVIINNNHDLRVEVEKNKILKGQEYYNLESSCLSSYLHEYECRILECMYTNLVGMKIIKGNVTTLCADGIMIRNDVGRDIEQIMRDLEISIESVTGFKVKLEKKDMNKGYNLEKIKENTDEEKKNGNPESYENKKIEFEKKNFKILNPIMYATEMRDKLVLNNKTDFKSIYENYLYTHNKLTESGMKEVETSFTDKWMADETMRTYEKIDFLPKQEAPDYIYNTFKGYVVEKLESNDKLDIKKSLIYSHLNNLCGNDEKVFDYVLKVLSRIVKNPGKLTNICLLFKSAPGAGKDTFFDWFGNNIIGREYMFKDSNTELLFGRFNPSMQDKVLCVINEISYKETIKVIEKIKDAITRPINVIEEKGLKVFTNKNHITYVMLTNNDNPIKIEVNDRRFVCGKCNDKIANDPKYFDALNKEIESKKYDRAFYDYLLSIDSDNYNFTSNRPETEFNKDLKEMSVPVLSKYLETLLFKNANLKLKEVTIPAYKIFQSYCNYLSENNFKNEVSVTSFGLSIKKYETIEKNRTNEGNSYLINYKKLEDELVKMKHIEPIPKE